MGYRQRPDIEYGDFEDLDAFGRLKSSNSTLIWNGGSIFPGGLGEWTDMAYGFDPSSGAIDLTGAAIRLRKASQPGNVQVTWIESPYHLPSNVGRSNLCIFSFRNFPVLEPDHKKKIGFFHRKYDGIDFRNPNLDGYYFSSYDDGGQKYAFVVAENGLEVETIDIAAWLNIDMDPSSINFSKAPQTGWISLDNSSNERRIRAGFIIDGVPKKFIDFSPKNALQSPIMNQKFRMELEYTSDNSTTDTFIGFHQSYSIEETETETGKVFSSYVTGVTGDAQAPPSGNLLKTTEVLSFKLPIGLTGPLVWNADPPGPYWSFSELDSISVTSSGSDPTWVHLVSRPDTVRPGLTFNPLIISNINNVGSTYSSPIWYSDDVGSLDITNPANKSTVISSYLVRNDAPLNIKIDSGLCRLGYVLSSPNGPTSQSSVISVCITPSKSTSLHTITANWKCIT